MAEPISSQQALSQSADANLYDALDGNGAAASLIGWFVFMTTGDLQKGLDAMAAVNDGSFSVSTTQVAAQTKSLAEAQGTTDINGTPTATIIIDGESYDISSLLSSTVYYWANTTGSGKNTQTNYHMREVFTGLGDAPDDYDPNWDAANNAPEATPFSVEATETLSVYDANHEITNRPPTDVLEIDLRNGAIDADSDPLNVSGSVTLTGNSGTLTLTEGTTWWVTGNTLYIDQNSAELDDLLNGNTDTLTFSYSLTDGKSDPVETYVTVEITGTADQYNQSGTGNDTNTHDKADGNQNNQVLYVDQSVFPDDAFDFSFSGTITVSSSGLTSGPPQEQSTVSDANADDWATPAITISDSTSPQSQPLDVAGALDDFKVDYNISFNGQADNGDLVTVTLNYNYDYWYTA